MKRNDEFDRILDEALSEYRDAEALSGLEDRVMLRLQNRCRSRRTWLTWGFATAWAIALVGIAIWFLPGRLGQEQAKQRTSMLQRKVPSTTETIASELSTHMGNLPQKDHRERHKAGTADGVAAVQTPSAIGQQFPRPAPLSADERALLRLAQSDPEVLQTPPAGDVEIAIAPIEIKPLAEESAGDKGEN